MRGKRRLIGVFIIAFVAHLPNSAALLSIHSTGMWPENWPSELEDYRQQAWTLEPMGGDEVSITIYDIAVRDAVDFERLWASLLNLMDRGSQVTLRTGQLTAFGDPKPKFPHAVVRITTPPYSQVVGYPPMLDDMGRSISSDRVELWHRLQRGEVLSDVETMRLDLPEGTILSQLDAEAMRTNNGRWLDFGPPWPSFIRNEAGDLPDVVHYEDLDGRLKWVAGPFPKTSIGMKCRIDLEIIVREGVVDPSQLEFPEYLKIIDKRAGITVPK